MLRLTLALPLLALFAVVLPGCPDGCANGDDCSSGPWNTPQYPDMAMNCPSACSGGCGGGETCIVPAAITQDHAFCGKACADDRDCAAGARCIVLFASMQAAACIDDSLAIGCGGSSGACDTQPACDGDVANVRFTDGARGICGWERVHCPSGCSNGACN